MPGWQAEADAPFETGGLGGQDFNPSSTNVASCFIAECLQFCLIVPKSMPDMTTACFLEGRDMPTSSRLHVALTASRDTEDAIPDPFSFQFDRHVAPRDVHFGPRHAQCASARTGAPAPGGRIRDLVVCRHRAR